MRNSASCSKNVFGVSEELENEEEDTMDDARQG